MEEYTKRGFDPSVRKQVLELTVNGSGTRATARALKISTNTVTSILKKEPWVEQVNYGYLLRHRDDIIEFEIVSAEKVTVNEAEMDEMWSFVHDKSQQYWLWWAIDHNTREPLAYCFGTREHKYLDELRELLAPFSICKIYTDKNYAYQNHITESTVITGKENTQRIERKHLSLRTWCSRLVRKGIRFSKSHLMHRIVIGIIINYWFFDKPLPDA